jgi:preprotein translocase subunit SecG
VYPSLDTLIGIGQKNSLNFCLFRILSVAENFFVLRSSSCLNKNMARSIYNSATCLFYSILFLYIMLTCGILVSEPASLPICSAFSFGNSSLVGLCKFSRQKITSVYCLFHVLFCCFIYVPKMFKKSMNSVKHVKLFMRRNPVLL